MGALSSARHAGATLVRNPVLFLAAAAFAVIQIPQILLQAGGFTFVASFYNIVTVLVTPFLVGGVYGMAREGLDGTTSFDTFLREGRENYVSLLVAAIFFALVVFVVAFVGIFAVVFVTILSVGVSGLENGVSAGALVLPGLVALAFLVVYLLTVVFLQFYEAAIVVDDADVLDSFKRSYAFVREQFLSTLGFTVVRWLPTLASTAVTGYLFLSAAGFDPENLEESAQALQNPYGALSTTEVGLVVALTLVSAGLVGAFVRTYLVAFYVDNRTEPPVDDADDEDDLFDEEYDTIRYS